MVEQGGLGPIDRIFEPGRLARRWPSGNPLRCSAVTLRVAAFDEVGGFDPRFEYVVDWDCWLRLSRKWQVAWLARPTVQVRWHSASETHRFKTGLADLDETVRMLDKLFDVDLKDHADVARLRRAANDRLGRAFLNRAHDALRAGLARTGSRRVVSGISVLAAPASRRSSATPGCASQMAALAAAPGLAARLFGAERSLTARAKPPQFRLMNRNRLCADSRSSTRGRRAGGRCGSGRDSNRPESGSDSTR